MWPWCRLPVGGIGRAMVDWCLQAIANDGLGRCHILVDADNLDGIEFWKRLGWGTRPHLHLLSFTMDENRA